MGDFAHKVFRFGPASIVPLMIVVSVAYSPWRHYESWPVYLILLGAPVTAIWHMVLIAVERPRFPYICYALANSSLYVLLGMVCLALITGDSP